jgi:uncharacterized membrane protein YdjX (TVP38/TMEM64 family)
VRLSRTARRAILAVLVVAFVASAITLWATGLITPRKVGAWLDSLGPAAPAIYVAVFVAGSFFTLPGMAFVVGGRLAFGPYLGFAVGYTGGVLAVLLPFLLARRLRSAGADPWRPKQKYLARAMAEVERHPFRTVLLLRLVLWFNSAASYALAFGPIPFRTYAAACAIALAPVVAAAVIATSWFL